MLVKQHIANRKLIPPKGKVKQYTPTDGKPKRRREIKKGTTPGGRKYSGSMVSVGNNTESRSKTRTKGYTSVSSPLPKPSDNRLVYEKSKGKKTVHSIGYGGMSNKSKVDKGPTEKFSGREAHTTTGKRRKT